MKILLLSPGRQVYLVERFKKYFEVVIGDNSEYSLNTFSINSKYLMPKYKDQTYKNSILSIVRNEKVDMVLSLSDIEITILSSYEEELKALNCILISLPHTMASICLDKFDFACFLSKNSILTPKTYETFKSVWDALYHNKISYPIIVKERKGMGSKGVALIHNETELEYYSDINLDILEKYVFQEYIVGVEYGIDIINDLKGDYYCSVTRKKISMCHGETEAATIIDHPTITSLAVRLSQLFKHKGNMDCDILQDNNGSLYVIDMNPRFGGGYIFSLAAGVDVPFLIHEWALSRAVPKVTFEIGKSYRKITALTEMSFSNIDSI